MKNRKRYQICILFSIMIAAVWMLFGEVHSQKTMYIENRKIQQERLTAWWGTLYPEFCYSQLPENAGETGGKPKVKISFWLAHVLDW